MELLFIVIAILTMLSAADAHLWPRSVRSKHKASRRRPASHALRQNASRRRAAPSFSARSLARLTWPRHRASAEPLWWWE